MALPLIPLLLGLAPTVASWIAGDKTGAAIGKVTGIAREILGTDDVGAIERAIAADPEKALQFRIAVVQAEADARRVEFETLQAQLADVASARHQTVELARAGSLIAWGAPIVSVLITVGFFVMLWLVIRKEIPEGSRDLANIMLGSLGTSFTAVVSYWVGSSAGSASKDAALRAAIGK
jgi:ABC-type multidrug transport system permease subunit